MKPLDEETDEIVDQNPTFRQQCEEVLGNAEPSSPEQKYIAIENLCSVIAKESSLIRRGEMMGILTALCPPPGNMTEAQWKRTIKNTVDEFITAEKKRLKEEGEGLGLQDGVDEKEAMEFGIYEYKGRYWGIGKFGKYEISNFTIKVLYHVKTSDIAAYRLIEIKNIYGKNATINLNTDDFVSLGAFKKVVARFGNFIFKGSDSDLAKLQEKIQRDEKPTRLVQTLGWNKRGSFYAFANGIVPCPAQLTTDTPLFEATDEYGIIEHEEHNFFIPANSKIFEDKESQFTNDKKFIFLASEHIAFKDWCTLTYKVYGEKSIVGTLYYLSSLYRDIIFKVIGRRFPMLYCYGQRGAGKGTFIESYLWPFGHPQDQIMLGGASTVVGFMRKFAQFSNALVWLDEYKNNLAIKIIESLKNLYDGIGYERGKKDNTFETESIPINSAALLSGQEMPTIEPALFTRVILLSFKPGKNFTAEDRLNYKKLKTIQEKGLSHITAHIVRHRTLFMEKYKSAFDSLFPEIIAKVNNREIDERMILNITVLAATYKVAAEFLDFPYEYETAEKYLIENMKDQFEVLAGSDDVAKWWQTVENLFTMRMIEEGRDFELQDGYLFIRIQQVHPLYLKELRSRNDPHTLEKSTLEHYLQMDSNVYVEKLKKRFNDNSNTWTYKFIYRKLDINLIRRESEQQTITKELEMLGSSTESTPGPEIKNDLPF